MVTNDELTFRRDSPRAKRKAEGRKPTRLFLMKLDMVDVTLIFFINTMMMFHSTSRFNFELSSHYVALHGTHEVAEFLFSYLAIMTKQTLDT